MNNRKNSRKSIPAMVKTRGQGGQTTGRKRYGTVAASLAYVEGYRRGTEGAPRGPAASDSPFRYRKRK